MLLSFMARRGWLRHSTPRLSLAVGIVFLIPAPFVAMDLGRSIEEQGVLQSGRVCSDPQPTCLTSEQATFEGPSYERRTRLRVWWATDDLGEVDRFELLPKWDEDARLLAGRGTVYRVDGRIVAVSSSNTHVPTALSGSHAVIVDIFGLLAMVGSFYMGLRTALLSRGACVGWSDKIPPEVLRRRDLDMSVFLVGVLGVIASLGLAMEGIAAWGVTGSMCAGVLLLPQANRLVRHLIRLDRQRRGTGRHAA